MFEESLAYVENAFFPDGSWKIKCIGAVVVQADARNDSNF